MISVFTNGLVDRVSTRKTQKLYLMPPCLRTHIIRYTSMASIEIQGKVQRTTLLISGVAIEKGNLL